MTAPKITGFTVRGSASYRAAALIYSDGPKTQAELFAVIDFGPKNGNRAEKIARALDNGWLVEGAGGKLDIGSVARAHFAYEAGEAVEEAPADDKPIGQIAAPRQHPNIFTCPPLSKKYIPNSRGLRQDIPTWSVRSGVSLHTKA